MMGVLLSLIAVGLVAGCYGSEGLAGQADTNTDAPTDPLVEVPPTGCGNGVVEGEEECDDGDADDCNGCTTECIYERAIAAGSVGPGAEVPAASMLCVPCPFTVEAWFRLDDETGAIALIEAPGFLTLRVSTSRWEYESPIINGMGVWAENPEPVPGTWHHIAFVCQGEGLEWRFHHVMDGTGFYSGGGVGGLVPETCADSIEFATGGPLHYPAGVVDDIRISSTALYPRGGTAFTPDRYLSVGPDTVALWNFNQVVDGVIPDVSGNGHDAILVEGTLVPDDCHRP
jgi:cysteine-rich repeat protein